jgi:hypothetical protein
MKTADFLGQNTFNCLRCAVVALCIVVAAINPPAAQAQSELPPPPPPPTQEQQQQQREQDRENDRREAERQAEERQRRMEEQRQIRRTLDQLGKVRPPTAEDRRVRRARFFPDFIKDVEKLEQLSIEIKQAPLKEIRKKAAAIEDRVDDLLEFIMDGEKLPPPPDIVLDPNLVQANANFLYDLNGPLVYKLVLYIRSERERVLIDVNLISEVVRELQIAKLVSRLLKK